MPPSVNYEKKERELIESKDVCRIATVSASGWPHAVPVGYVFEKGLFYVPTTEKAKRIRNLKRVGKATLLVDDEKEECGVMLECVPVPVSERAAKEWRRYMRKVRGWTVPETTPILGFRPLRKTSWFLKS